MLSGMLTSPFPKIRIANFTRILAGTYASLIRSEFGDEIWRIIRPGTVGNWILAQRNERRNEKSLALKSDAWKENFKKGEMKELRLWNEELSKRNEGILSCSVKGDENFFEIARALGGNGSPFDYPMSSHDRRWPGSSGDDDEPPEDPEDYGPGGYHPVSIGDVIHERYRVIRKLGWGSSSTVWLCCDAADQRLVALKIVKSAKFHTDAATEEVKMLLACKEDKNGENLKRVVQLFDNFTLEGPNGTHVCLVLEVFGDDLLKAILAYERRGLNTMVAGPIVRDVLEGLCHLHGNNIVHTDIKPGNVLTSQVDIKQKAAEHFASSRDRWDKVNNPPKLDILPGSGLHFQRPRTTKAWIAAVEKEYWAWRNQIWETKIADLGSACWAHDRHIEDVQSRQYRSLELIIGAEFGPPTDIWSTACLAFELATGKHLFGPNEPGNSLELARIVERLGPVPPHIFKKGSEWRDLFHESGSLLHPPEEGLEPLSVREFLTEEDCLTDWEAEQFADFLTSMLKYDPNERATAAECLKHPWIKFACKRFFIGYPSDDSVDESDDEDDYFDHYYGDDDDDIS